jgi:nucleoside-diphosphate-sugar epimerase
MPTAFVTGGTGFVGLNLVKALRERAWDVVAIHRRSSDLTLLETTGARLVVADATDAASLLAAMPERVDAVFHVAASTNFWRYGNVQQTRANVDGTSHMVEAALARGARRFVHTSSIGAYGHHEGQRISEHTPSNAPDHWVNYLRTKWLAEEEVRRGIEKGLSAVILNPANILGPYDLSGWSRVFVLLEQRRLPGLLPGSGSWCHVRDVVAAHISAVEKGGVGENYMLGGPVASYAEVMGIAAVLLGTPLPRAVPRALLRVIGRDSQWASLITRKAPDVTPEIALILGSNTDCDSAKAERVLGYSTCSVAEMVRDSYDWLVATGRIKA